MHPGSQDAPLPGHIPREIPPDYSHLIPFILPAQIISGMRMGRGQLFLVTGAASVAVTLKHNLGRPPKIVLILDNGVNQLGDRTVSLRSATQCTFTPTRALTNALIWLL